MRPGLQKSFLVEPVAVPRKGWRRISVEGRIYHWRGNGAVGLRQRAAVAPGAVWLAIEHALAADPPFTGAAGAADVTLSPQALAEVQARARIDLSGN